MRQVFDARLWRHETIEKDGDQVSSIFADLRLVEFLQFEVRAPQGLIVNFIDHNKRTIFYGEGQVVSFDGKITGVEAVEVVCDGPFAYRSAGKLRWYETPDPAKVVLNVPLKGQDAMRQMMVQEIRKHFARSETAALFTSDQAMAEFLDDIENGDLEFDQEPDQFGLGFQEAPPAPQEPQEPPAAPAAAASSSAPPPPSAPPGNAAEPVPPSSST